MMSHDEFTKLFKYFDKRFDAIDERFKEVDKRFDYLTAIVLETAVEVRELSHTVNGLVLRTDLFQKKFESLDQRSTET